MTGNWELQESTQTGPIGEAKGSFDNYLRRLNSQIEAYEVRCITGPFSETVLVYNPIAQIINETSIYACVVIWKDYNTGEAHSQNVLVGDINETALINDENYFNLLMTGLLEKSRIDKCINQNVTPQYECNNYVGRIKPNGDGKYIKEYDQELSSACAQSVGLTEKASFLGTAIYDHQHPQSVQHR